MLTVDVRGCTPEFQAEVEAATTDLKHTVGLTMMLIQMGRLKDKSDVQEARIRLRIAHYLIPGLFGEDKGDGVADLLSRAIGLDCNIRRESRSRWIRWKARDVEERSVREVS